MPHSSRQRPTDKQQTINKQLTKRPPTNRFVLQNRYTLTICALSALEPTTFKDSQGFIMNKAIITVVGHDTVGIIARVCTYLSDSHVNVLDISQTIIDGFFNMMMIVDYTNSTVDFSELNSHLEALGEEIGVNVHCQREEIFTKMHRI